MLETFLGNDTSQNWLFYSSFEARVFFELSRPDFAANVRTYTHTIVKHEKSNTAFLYIFFEIRLLFELRRPDYVATLERSSSGSAFIFIVFGPIDAL